MIALADNDYFRQGMMLLKWGVPYECIFGAPRVWSKTWRNAATLVINDYYSPEETMGLD